MSEPNMTSEIVSLRNENAVLKEELALANQQLAWFRKQIFGRKQSRHLLLWKRSSVFSFPCSETMKKIRS
ncbi:hypothetical protein [Ruminococcus albus]|uniref:Transposase n=1 Tax=Ruminococcus albus (strain ATCC 27210 / DSM 20455 / JCM 14654 / NCDO 2250 / 7) TaxID=697329 RepID=E6UDB8_RUMA7|nr:hypothetical protein [Ruminococcus albus]ADU22801.1 hypothetical protein Rumal_2319 [Ruminococcus albus 7 = DSM 20455]